jgi:O-succinylbenzoate synthase
MQIETALFQHQINWETARGKLTQRSGIIFRARETPDLPWNYGEASPLETHSKETLSDCLAWLSNPTRAKNSAPAAVRFALDSLAVWSKVDRTLLNKTKTNAVLDFSANESDVKSALSRGLLTIKLKIAPENLSCSLALMNYAKAFCPEVKFRLDANGSFKNTDIPALLAALNGLAIDYIEDPIASFDEELIKNFRTAGISLGKDASVGVDPDVLVLKPTVIGDFLTLREKIATQRSRGGRAVITSCLESDIGSVMVAWLAVTLNPEEIHGVSIPGESIDWTSGLDWRKVQ